MIRRVFGFMRDWARTLAGGLAASVVVVLLVSHGQLEPLEDWSLAKLFDLRGPRPPSTPIVIVTIDESPFPDPDHAANAVRTGLEFQERTRELSARWEAKLGVAIRNGVGINTGEAVVGILGSDQRLEYTAIGDTINLGSRLESITKENGEPIIISESTHELVQGQFATRELGAVTVKGKTRPVKIYAVLSGEGGEASRATAAVAA